MLFSISFVLYPPVLFQGAALFCRRKQDLAQDMPKKKTFYNQCIESKAGAGVTERSGQGGARFVPGGKFFPS